MDFLIIKNLSKKYNDQIVLDKVNLSFPSKGLFFLLLTISFLLPLKEDPQLLNN